MKAEKRKKQLEAEEARRPRGEDGKISKQRDLSHGVTGPSEWLRPQGGQKSSPPMILQAQDQLFQPRLRFKVSQATPYKVTAIEGPPS